ncbi:hypothetical protein P5G51_001835 [Virgibacillus sp. 179-BFC.A HS]|uniref:Uncharacterized protein n=1 Tax=Tigheibacillus jepli TaxID=3035914 RepID=A0ABU5CEP1_9BACI|nr:hypothetical protein [Virgibacillus sp. 179-BFC.A HS]MDY0404322.1 hypothetical protein [Virgibacillus sp. 179-BFC.A HS]
MEPLATLPYYQVIREVKSIEQVDTEEKRELKLYPEQVVSKHHAFSLNEVTDITYRWFGKERGLLYLYTMKGIYTFTVKEKPEAFLQTYRQLSGKP